MKKLLLILFFLLTFYSSRSQIVINKHWYTVLYDTTLLMPETVKYTLTCKNTIGTAKRPNRFSEEYLLPKHLRRKTEEYLNSGFDRGHLVPAADFKYSQEALESTFSVANIVPQTSVLNRQSWKRVETYLRGRAIRFDSIVVLCGGLEWNINKLPVPQRLWKIAYCYRNGEIVIINGWLFYNNNTRQAGIISHARIIRLLSDKTKDTFEILGR